MARELSLMLELAAGNPKQPKRLKSELASLLEARKEVYAYKNGAIEIVPKVRELLLSEAVERTGLIQTEIFNTVISGAKSRVCMREIMPKVSMDRDMMNIPIGTPFIYAPKVAEGAEIPSIYQNYTYKTLQVEKFAYKIPISHELLQDCKFDLMGIEEEKVGASIENTLNRNMLTELLDNAGNEHDTTGSDQGIVACVNARKEIETDHFMPDVVVCHPQFYAKILLDYKPAYNQIAQGVLQSGILPDIAGLRPVVLTIADASSTYIWEYDTDGDIGGLVLDTKNAGIIGMREDISVEMHEDAFKMVDCPIIWARFDQTFIHANAICRVEY